MQLSPIDSIARKGGAMTSPSVVAPGSLRIEPKTVLERLARGERITLLDSRGPQAWEPGREKAQGAIRVPPDQVRVDASWPKDQLTVVY
jgi:hypothetical protein